ncbi:DNA polymerase III subunit delta [Embleya sp. NPDC005971]|uniref:DNA polymerase III subunit delta n=1 Tax=Embleya sp. NPDC005971 TaxID=3156724 RepID=UPI0033C76A95
MAHGQATGAGRRERSADARLLPGALAVWTAAWIAPLVPLRATVTASAGAVLGAAVLARLPTVRRRATVAVVLVCLAAGGLVAGLRTAADHAGPVAAAAGRQAEATVELTVRTDPERRGTRVRGSELGGPPTVFAARIDHVRVAPGSSTRTDPASGTGRSLGASIPGGTRVRTPVTVLATGPEAGSWLGLLPSTPIRAHGRLVPGKGGQALLLVRSAPERIGAPAAHQRFAGRLRAHLRAACADLPPAARGLLPGLVVGDTGMLPADLEADFRTTELTHLTAVSGTNITILLGFVLLVLRRGGLRGRALPITGAVAVACFVVVARPEPSVLRAAVMGLVTLAALYTGRPRRGLPALAVAVLGLVLFDPTLARSYAFALSVLATGALLLLAPHWAARLCARGWPKWAAVPVAVPLAAQAVCGPLVVSFAGRVGLMAVPCNLLAEFAVAPATILGFVALVLAPVCLPLAQAAAWLGSWPIRWIVTVAHTGAALPGAAVTWPTGLFGGAVLAAITVAAVPTLRALRRPRSTPFGGSRATTAALLALLAVVLLLRPPAVVRPLTGWPPPDWHLVMCDVGQGDAIVLNAGPGTGVLVDAGPDPRAVDRCLRDLGIRRLPLILLSHFHADHVEGLPGALRDRAVGLIQGTSVLEPMAEVTRVRRWATAAGIALSTPTDAERRSRAALTWQTLAPPPTALRLRPGPRTPNPGPLRDAPLTHLPEPPRPAGTPPVVPPRLDAPTTRPRDPTPASQPKPPPPRASGPSGIRRPDQAPPSQPGSAPPTRLDAPAGPGCDACSAPASSFPPGVRAAHPATLGPASCPCPEVSWSPDAPAGSVGARSLLSDMPAAVPAEFVAASGVDAARLPLSGRRTTDSVAPAIRRADVSVPGVSDARVGGPALPPSGVGVPITGAGDLAPGRPWAGPGARESAPVRGLPVGSAVGGSVANNASLVVLAERHGVRMLLTGDAEIEAQEALRDRLAGLRVDVLKVAHHGSSRQDPGLVLGLHPRLALVSVGKGNPYGHPSPSARALVAATGARLLRTDTDGPIAVTGSPAHLDAVARGPDTPAHADRLPAPTPAVVPAVAPGPPRPRTQAHPRTPPGRLRRGAGAGRCRPVRRGSGVHRAPLPGGRYTSRPWPCSARPDRLRAPSTSPVPVRRRRGGGVSVGRGMLGRVARRMQDDPLAPVTLVVGAEELLVDRAIGEVVRAVRAQDPDADVRDLAPGALQAGMLSELASPSLFGERKVIVIRSAQDLGTDLAGEVKKLIADPADEIVLVLAHLGGPKGKNLLDAVRKVGVREVTCPKVTKVGDRVAFARSEFRIAGRSLTEDACRTLVEAIGNDLRELASACSQLMADTDGVVDEEVVARYYSGVAEASSFTVADKTVEGRTAEALEQLRWALSVGVAPVMVTSALAQSVRQIARVGAAPRNARPNDLARDLGMPPWKVDRVRQQLRGWTPDGIVRALCAVADADAAVKGGGTDPAYALEKAVVTVSTVRNI